MTDHLLTVADVARLLNLSSKTVYKHKRRLGGFYPAGIRVLRFSPETIQELLAGAVPSPNLTGPAGSKAEQTIPRRALPRPKTGEEKRRLAAELGLKFD